MSRAPAENEASYLDATELARTQSTWEYDYTQTRFPRLKQAAAADMPRVSVQLRFTQWDGRPAIHGHLSGSVELICQRCLKSMRQPLDESFELVLLASDDELQNVPESYEALVLEAARLDVRWLVEEQLLLALPLIPRHAQAADCCVEFAAAEDEAEPLVVEVSHKETTAADEGQRPFQNLRELLRNKS